ncbi:MAG: hypothetical protein ACI9QL_003794 [Candidatus Omnitrophota bacterium]|jgi:hypothetical protein
MHIVPGIVQQGHRAASGANGNPKFPGGTIRMQIPFFKALGLDLSGLYPGTINVSVTPHVFEPIRPTHAFKQLQWCDDAAEDFSFFTCELMHAGETHRGWIYWPSPDTKPAAHGHEQNIHIVELLMPWIEGLAYGDAVSLVCSPEETAWRSMGL